MRSVAKDNRDDDRDVVLSESPGEALHYSVEIPRDHPPGLFWYHTHPRERCAPLQRVAETGAVLIPARVLGDNHVDKMMRYL